MTIRFEYENNQYEVRTVNGVSQKVYVPFVALTGALLDTSHFSNVTVSNGKLINDGDRIAVMGMAFPACRRIWASARSNSLDLPDYVEISADVTDFTLETTLTVVSNSLLNEVDTDDLTSGDLGSLSDSPGQAHGCHGSADGRFLPSCMTDSARCWTAADSCLTAWIS